MRQDGTKPDLHTYAIAIEACATTNLADEAVLWLGVMREDGLVPAAGTYIAVIRACLSVKRLEEALGWLKGMADLGLAATGEVYDAVVEQSLVAGRWEDAAHWLRERNRDEMVSGESHVRRVGSHNKLVQLLAKECREEHCLGWLGTMRR